MSRGLAALEQLVTLSGVRHALLVQTDGLLVAQQSARSEIPSHDTIIRVAAMTATALSLNKRIAGALGSGSLTEASITGTEGRISLYAVGGRTVLALVSDLSADVELISRGVKEALESLAGG